MTTPWEYVEQGDCEAALVDELMDAPEIINFSGGAPRISTDLVGFQKGLRWIKVSREGGSKAWPNIDKPRIDINVFAETRTVAHHLAQVAEAVLFRAMGQAFPDHNLFLSDVAEETGPVRVDDPKTGTPRYVFALRLVVVPL